MKLKVTVLFLQDGRGLERAPQRLAWVSYRAGSSPLSYWSYLDTHLCLPAIPSQSPGNKKLPFQEASLPFSVYLHHPNPTSSQHAYIHDWINGYAPRLASWESPWPVCAPTLPLPLKYETGANGDSDLPRLFTLLGEREVIVSMAGDEVMRIKSEGLALASRLLRPISFKYLTQSTIWETLVPMTPTNQRRYLNNDTHAGYCYPRSGNKRCFPRWAL